MNIMFSDLHKVYKNMCKDKDIFFKYFYDNHDIYALNVEGEFYTLLEEKNINIIIDFEDIYMSNSWLLCNEDGENKILKYYNECCRKYEKHIIDYFERELKYYEYWKKWKNFFLESFLNNEFVPESVYSEKYEIDNYPMFIRHTFVENLWKQYFSTSLVEKRRKRIRMYDLCFDKDKKEKFYRTYKDDYLDFFIGV